VKATLRNSITIAPESVFGESAVSMKNAILKMRKSAMLVSNGFGA